MPSIKSLSLLALAAGTAFALPTPAEEGQLAERDWRGGNRWWQHATVESETIVWVTVTGYGDSSPETAAPTPTPSPAAPVEQPSVPVPAAASPTITAAPSPPVATASPSAPSSGSSDSGSGYLGIVNKWRSAGGLPSLNQDGTLEGNALKTSTDSVGGLKHELNPGTFAQVLAPGTPSNFENVLVGGWLCELPSLPGLDGICATMAQGWAHDGETGHAEILTSTSYSKIGCARADDSGVWACDLA